MKIKKVLTILSLTAISSISMVSFTACSHKDTTIFPTSTNSEKTPDSETSDYNEDSDINDKSSISLDDISGDLEITEGGSYVLSGTLTNGKVLITANEKVHLYLENASITSNDGAAIASFCKKKTVITLVEGTDNSLSDSKVYSTFYNDDNDEPNACIFAKDDLTINGNGSLTITATGSFSTYEDGKEETKYASGIVTKDELKIQDNPSIKINAIGHGIKGKDFVEVYGGNINIDCDKKGIVSSNSSDSELGYVYIEAGAININKCNEGIEAKKITLAGGDINITSADDGINASVDGDESECLIEITGGNLTINSSGDGIDSNGNIIMTGGFVFVDGPIGNDNGSLDAGDKNNYIKIDGGTLICIGSNGMVENPSDTSSQVYSSFSSNLNISENDTIEFTDDNGNSVSVKVLKSRSGNYVIQTSIPNTTSGSSYKYKIAGNELEYTAGQTVAGGFGGGPGGFGGGPGGFGDKPDRFNDGDLERPDGDFDNGDFERPEGDFGNGNFERPEGDFDNGNFQKPDGNFNGPKGN